MRLNRLRKRGVDLFENVICEVASKEALQGTVLLPKIVLHQIDHLRFQLLPKVNLPEVNSRIRYFSTGSISCSRFMSELPIREWPNSESSTGPYGSRVPTPFFALPSKSSTSHSFIACCVETTSREIVSNVLFLPWSPPPPPLSNVWCTYEKEMKLKCGGLSHPSSDSCGKKSTRHFELRGVYKTPKSGVTKMEAYKSLRHPRNPQEWPICCTHNRTTQTSKSWLALPRKSLGMSWSPRVFLWFVPRFGNFGRALTNFPEILPK